jgi:hypothetical protein
MLANLASDPVLGIAGGNLEELLTAPTQTSGTIGTPSNDTSKGVTGSLQEPEIGKSFAIGYCDETELYEFAPTPASGSPQCPGEGSTGSPYTSASQYDSCQGPPLNTLPAGTVSNSAPVGYQSTGPGLPYVAIYAVDSTSGQIGGKALATVPVTVATANYTAVGAAWMPKNQPTHTAGTKFQATLSFSVSGLELSSSETYVAYLLVRDTDQSGPLADHMWYFTP